MFGGDIMQQVKSYSFFKRTPQLVNKVVAQLFDDEPLISHHHDVTLLNRQPAFQRRLFLKLLIHQKLTTFFQLTPINAAGHVVNVTGTIRHLDREKYLISASRVNYIVDFNHINYIARPE